MWRPLARCTKPETPAAAHDGAHPVLGILKLCGHRGVVISLIEQPAYLPMGLFDPITAMARAVGNLGRQHVRWEFQRGGHDGDLQAHPPIYLGVSTRIRYESRYA